jgi:hypothetical protein
MSPQLHATAVVVGVIHFHVILQLFTAVKLNVLLMIMVRAAMVHNFIVVLSTAEVA